jgi:ACT domain-containing protein
MSTLAGYFFMRFGGLVRFIYGTLIRKLGISKAPYYSLKEYIHGSERPEDDHWDKGSSHLLVNKVVGMISIVLIIFVILAIGGCNNPMPMTNSDKGSYEITECGYFKNYLLI